MNQLLANMHLVKNDSLRQTQTRTKPEAIANQAQPATSFQNVLEVQFSKHAALRLTDRNINLTHDQIDRVASGIGKAGEKGIRDSLVLVDDVALVVNVKSRTVITAMNQVSDNVFSNIDGAVIV